MGCSVSSLKTIDYEDISEGLKTGDLVLFSGNSLYSRIVQCFTINPISHVGMVIKCKDRKGHDSLYLFHSIITTIKGKDKDFITKKEKNGPQMNPLKSSIINADGDVFIRRLNLDSENSTLKSDHCGNTEISKWIRRNDRTQIRI
jgi:hypothetical protein